MLMQINVGSRVKTNLSACSLGHSSCGLGVHRENGQTSGERGGSDR
jgi:hypothetical protein